MTFKELEQKFEKNDIPFFSDGITRGEEYYVNFNAIDRYVGLFTPKEKEDRKFNFKDEPDFLDEIWETFKIVYEKDLDVSWGEREFSSLLKYTKKELVE